MMKKNPAANAALALAALGLAVLGLFGGGCVVEDAIGDGVDVVAPIPGTGLAPEPEDAPVSADASIDEADAGASPDAGEVAPDADVAADADVLADAEPSPDAASDPDCGAPEPPLCEVPADLDLSGVRPFLSLMSLPTSTWTSGDAIAARVALTAPDATVDIAFHQFVFIVQTNTGATLMPLGIREVGVPLTMAGAKTVECEGIPCHAFTLTVSLDEPFVVAGGTTKFVELIIPSYGVASGDWLFTKLAIRPTSVGCALGGDGPYDIDGRAAWTIWSDGDWFVEGSEWQSPLDGHLLVAL